jgi:hypothetical protein
MDGHGCLDSGYNSGGTDVTMTEDTDKCYTTELDESGQPLRQISDPAEPSEFEEAKRKYGSTKRSVTRPSVSGSCRTRSKERGTF